jgi:peptidoglycan/xylan/chitin deacetylase (PgdA/CDA1 family)
MPSHAQSAETLERWRRFPALERLPPDPARPRAVLTFDDGPDPDGTPAVLDALDEADAKATFFLVGEQLMRHHAIAREIHQRGHELALHCFEHADPDVWPPPVARDDVARGLGTFEVVAGRRPRWYRPPYGRFTEPSFGAVQALKLEPVYWTAWGLDWEPIPGERIADLVVRDLEDGAIVLLHDSVRYAPRESAQPTAEAIAPIAAAAAERGLSLVTLGEAAGGLLSSPA